MQSVTKIDRRHGKEMYFNQFSSTLDISCIMASNDRLGALEALAYNLSSTSSKAEAN